MKHSSQHRQLPAAHMEQSQVELALPAPLPVDAKALAKWLQTQLSIDREPSKISTDPAKTVTWAGQNLQQPRASGGWIFTARNTLLTPDTG